MEQEGSLPRLQIPAPCPYPEPDQRSPFPNIPSPDNPSSYYSPIYAWVFQIVSFLRLPHQTPVYISPLLIRVKRLTLVILFVTIP